MDHLGLMLGSLRHKVCSECNELCRLFNYCSILRGEEDNRRICQKVFVCLSLVPRVFLSLSLLQLILIKKFHPLCRGSTNSQPDRAHTMKRINLLSSLLISILFAYSNSHTVYKYFIYVCIVNCNVALFYSAI